MNDKEEQNIFSYDPDDVKDLYDYVIKERNNISQNHEFIGRFNINQLIKMLFNASAKQIGDFRGHYLRYIDMQVKQIFWKRMLQR